jgi:ribonuclease HI
MSEIIIYTDGSSLGNPGPGGYGVVLRFGDKLKELSGGFRMTTNNRMEILAAIKALEALKDGDFKIKLHSDSKLLCDAFNRNWLTSWRKKGWKKADKKPVLNRDLWERLVAYTDKMDVEFIWVKAHDGNPDNERCDELAKLAAETDNLQIDREYEGDNPHSGLFSSNMFEDIQPLKEEILKKEMAGNVLCTVYEESYGKSVTFEKNGNKITVEADALPVFVRQILEIGDKLNFG